jgi:hypothetical protein
MHMFTRTHKYRVSEKDCTFFKKFFFGPLLFGGRHLENFVPTGTAGISIKIREYLVAISATYTTLHTLGT